jgi:tRNA pseudouridine38-40 synthase
MPRYMLTVAYDGTNFHGWQKQTPLGDADALRTAQGVLEEAVQQVVREDVNVVGASRTDAGVHAEGQVAAFTSAQEIPVERLPAAINARLPDDLQVRGARIVPDTFSPITDAVSKGYRYTFAHGCRIDHPRPLFDRHFVFWTAYDLDSRKMHDAAQHFRGEHDFTSFTRLHHGRDSTVRTIFDCEVHATGEHRCEMNISGGGFLYNMVRIIAGTLVEVGRGELAVEDIPRIIEARDRTQAGPTLPPEGLCLMWIKYPEIG